MQLGDIQLRLNGVIAQEPDRNAGGFPLAPRLMVRHDTLKAAGLLRPGALINYHYRLRLPDNADNGAVKAVVGATQERFPLPDGGCATAAMPRPPCAVSSNASACF